MASITNTTISSYDFLLRQCYSSNRNARKAYARTTMNSEDLITADSSALKKAIRNLKDMEYSSDNGINIYNNVKAFVDSYNNLYDSSSKFSAASAELERTEKKLKNYIKENKEELEKLGIKVSSSGKLTLDKEDLLSCSAKKVGKFFSDDNAFSGQVAKYMTRINRQMNICMSSGNPTKKTDNPLENLPVTTQTISPASIDVQA